MTGEGRASTFVDPAQRSRAGAQAMLSFLLRLRSRGIADHALLRALETVPRELFVPHRYADLALRDVALPIGCGQTMPEPLLLARALEALNLRPGHRVLEIGSGTGYATAVIARLAAEVVSLERFQTLALEASLRLEQLEIRNASVIWADGFALPAEIGLFDRIVLQGTVDAVPEGLLAVLAEGGVIVFGRRAGEGGGELVQIAHQPEGGFRETVLGPGRLSALMPGLASIL